MNARPFDPGLLAELLDGWPVFDPSPGWTAEELEAVLDGNLWPGGNL